MVQQGTSKEEALYTRRFTLAEQKVRDDTWAVLGPRFFQKYISEHDTVVDVGAGDGLLLRNIRAQRRIALDINPQTALLRDLGIEVIQAGAGELGSVLAGVADVLVLSNFLEHLPSKHVLLDILAEVRRALKPSGKVLILQPNIRYVGAAYWDYIDHHIALTECSLAEALDVTGFEIKELIPQFLPYTVKSSTGSLASLLGASVLTTWYLRLPLLWRLFGGQTFVYATPK